MIITIELSDLMAQAIDTYLEQDQVSTKDPNNPKVTITSPRFTPAEYIQKILLERLSLITATAVDPELQSQFNAAKAALDKSRLDSLKVSVK